MSTKTPTKRKAITKKAVRQAATKAAKKKLPKKAAADPAIQAAIEAAAEAAAKAAGRAAKAWAIPLEHMTTEGLTIKWRCKPEEYEMIKAGAREAGLTITGYQRLLNVLQIPEHQYLD